MKVKFNQYLLNTVETNYHRHLFCEIANHPDVEIVDNDSDISFNTSGRRTDYDTKMAVLIDRSDPHTRPGSFNIDLLVDENLAKIADPKRTKPSNYFKLPDWQIEVDGINEYDVWSPAFDNPLLKTAATKIVCPIGLPENIFFNSTNQRDIDIFFQGIVFEWYPLRKILHQELPKLTHLKQWLKNISGASVVKDKKTIEQYDNQLMEYANGLRRSKLCLFDGGVFNYPVKKYVECIATGCLVMAPVPKEAEYLGYIDGETMVSIDHTNFREKIEYYINNEPERKRITDNAYQLFTEKYALKKSTDIYINKLKQLL